MASLKTFAPYLAPRLHLTPNALYERQRALVRAGLLKGAAGRGPGSGVEATRESVALLLLTVLATDQLTDFAERAGEVLAAKCTTQTKCPITGKDTPVEALAELMKSEVTVRQLLSVRCFRVQQSFTFNYHKRQYDDIDSVTFWAGREMTTAPSILVVSEFYAKPALHDITEQLPGYVTGSARKEDDHG